MYRFTIIVVCLTILVFLTGTALADIPNLINYQGMLTDKITGDPITNPGIAITFRIYDHATSTDPANKKWEETHPSVAVTNGLFNVILGSQSKAALDLDFSEDYWLEIEVGGELTGERLQFTSVDYAYRASVADSAVVAGSSAGGVGGWVDDGTVVRLQDSTDAVGIGTAIPRSNLHLKGDRVATIRFDNGGDTSWVIGSDISDGGLRIDRAYSQGADLVAYVSLQGDTWLVPLRGNVGIGTTSPDDDLHVANHIRVGEDATYPSVYGELKHDGSNTGFRINAHAGGGWADMHLQTDGTTRVFVESGGNVGVGTTSPNSRLHVDGWMSMACKSVTYASSPYHLTGSDCIIAANASGGTVNIDLPPASGISGRVYTVKKTDSSSAWVNLWADSGDLIDGTGFVGLASQWQYLTVVSDGNNWLVVGR